MPLQVKDVNQLNDDFRRGLKGVSDAEKFKLSSQGDSLKELKEDLAKKDLHNKLTKGRNQDVLRSATSDLDNKALREASEEGLNRSRKFLAKTLTEVAEEAKRLEKTAKTLSEFRKLARLRSFLKASLPGIVAEKVAKKGLEVLDNHFENHVTLSDGTVLNSSEASALLSSLEAKSRAQELARKREQVDKSTKKMLDDFFRKQEEKERKEQKEKDDALEREWERRQEEYEELERERKEFEFIERNKREGDEDDEKKYPCDTSDQRDSLGRICGGRAATVKKGGRSPSGLVFYAGDNGG